MENDDGHREELHRDGRGIHGLLRPRDDEHRGEERGEAEHDRREVGEPELAAGGHTPEPQGPLDRAPDGGDEAR